MNNAGFERELTDWNTLKNQTTITSDAVAENHALANSTVRSSIDQGLKKVAGEPYTLKMQKNRSLLAAQL